MDTFTLLEKLLVYVVSIVCSFIDLNSNAYEMAHLFSSTAFVLAQDCTLLIDPSNAFKIPPAKLHPWKQTAVLAVMEAGGLNWLVGKVGIFLPFLFTLITKISLQLSMY